MCQGRRRSPTPLPAPFSLAAPPYSLHPHPELSTEMRSVENRAGRRPELLPSSSASCPAPTRPQHSGSRGHHPHGTCSWRGHQPVPLLPHPWVQPEMCPALKDGLRGCAAWAPHCVGHEQLLVHSPPGETSWSFPATRRCPRDSSQASTPWDQPCMGSSLPAPVGCSQLC